MMKKHFIFPAVIALFFSACKKDETSTPPEKQRYIEEVFADFSVQTLEYSSVSNLEMDIYQPVGDDNTDRPVVILAHGGGFFVGSKENPAMVRLGQNLAKRGYVTVSINYHLAPDFTQMLDSVNAADLVVKALGDGKAAVRFMRKSFENNNPYGIDTSRIFIGGNSAGAILSVHVAMLDQDDPISTFLQTAIDNNGGFEGNGGNPGYSSNVKAVFNLAGAIKNANMIDANDVPIINFHGVDDDVVPYNCGDVYRSLGLDLINVCGSNSIQNQADAVGAQSTLYSYPGEHVPWMDGNTGVPYPLFDEVETKVFDFLFAQL